MSAEMNWRAPWLAGIGLMAGLAVVAGA